MRLAQAMVASLEAPNNVARCSPANHGFRRPCDIFTIGPSSRRHDRPVGDLSHRDHLGGARGAQALRELGLIILFVALGAVTALLLWLIHWLRRSGSRYRFFDAFVSVFLIAAGSFLIWRLPSDPNQFVRFVAAGCVFSGVSMIPLVIGQFRAPRSLVCSFCGKDASSVRRLIAGPRGHICDDCVHTCSRMLDAADRPGRETPS